LINKKYSDGHKISISQQLLFGVWFCGVMCIDVHVVSYDSDW